MAPFELFGRNFCLATLQHWLCVVVLLRTENTCRPGRYGRESRQCCQVAEIPAKKLKRGHRKKKFVAEFWLILPKTVRKGATENFQNKFLIFSCWPNFLDVLAGNFFGTWQH